MKQHWTLDPHITFLNHGSFGATPRVVLEKQNEYRAQLEREPVRFFVRELEPMLDAARAELADFLGADPQGLAFVPNATTGVNAVLRSLDLDKFDELLVTTQEYNACRNALTDPRCKAMTVSQIALGFGFNDLSHFTKAFRARFSVPPGLYRKQH